MKLRKRNDRFASTDAFSDESSTRLLAPPGPRPPEVPATRSGLNAFLGKGCIYEGKLTFEGTVRIDGKFTGEIFSNDTLEVGPDAEIEAEVDVATVIVAGRVQGNVHARHRCDLRAPGEVVGNITSPVVTMEEGVLFDGEMRMRTALEESLRATSIQSPSTRSTIEGTAPFEGTDATLPPTENSLWRDAPGAPDPSDLMEPVP